MKVNVQPKIDGVQGDGVQKVCRKKRVAIETGECVLMVNEIASI